MESSILIMEPEQYDYDHEDYERERETSDQQDSSSSSSYVPFHDSGSNEEWNQWRDEVSINTILLFQKENDNFYQATLDRARDQFEKSSVAAHHFLETLHVKGQQVERQALRQGVTAFRNFFTPVEERRDEMSEVILNEELEESRMT